MVGVDNIRDEIVALHDFFVAWMAGSVPVAALETEMAARLDANFLIVDPSGQATSRADLLAGFAMARGSNPDFRIAVRDVEVRHHSDGLILATYTEWQKGGSRGENGRLSSVLMTDAAPFRWLHVHETGLTETDYPET